MSLNLTTDDLQAIKNIVNEAIDDSKIHTAAGFAEVHSKIDDLRDELGGVKQDVSILKKDVSTLKQDLSSVKQDLDAVKDDLSSVKQTVENIERVQRAEIECVDLHGREIKQIKQKLKLAPA